MRIAAADTKLTKAQVAGAVKRTVTVMDDGKPVEKQVAVKADEVFDWAIRDEAEQPVLVVVTTDGQKLTGEVPAPKK